VKTSLTIPSLIVLCIASFTLPAWAAVDLHVRGYLRETLLLWKMPEVAGGDGEQQLTNLLHTRQNLRWYAARNFTLGLEAKTRLFSGDAVQAMHSQTEMLGGNETLFKRDYRFLTESDQLLITTLDRAWVDWHSGNLQVTIGRQRIAWGSTLIWNPTDIFNPSSPFDFDNEEKPGVDGVRVQHYLGNSAKFELAFALTDLDNSDEMPFAGRLSFNAYLFDWSILLGSKPSYTLIGGGFEGDILGGGFRGEALYAIRSTNPSRQSSPPPWPTDGVWQPSTIQVDRNYLRFALDGDYTFRNSFYLRAGLRYNELGATEEAGSLHNQYRAFANEWLAPSRWSLFGQMGGSPTPLLSTDLMAILNPLDGSFYVGPSASYSLVTNLDLTLTALLFQGNPGTEFGEMGTIWMGRLKYSF